VTVETRIFRVALVPLLSYFASIFYFFKKLFSTFPASSPSFRLLYCYTSLSLSYYYLLIYEPLGERRTRGSLLFSPVHSLEELFDHFFVCCCSRFSPPFVSFIFIIFFNSIFSKVPAKFEIQLIAVFQN
jgi:hypothetical protein